MSTPAEVAIGDRVEMTFRRLVHRGRDPQLLLEGPTGPVPGRGGMMMGSHGIKDKVAIVGMGCTRFGEHWDQGTDELVVEAAEDAFPSAGVDQGATSTPTGSARRSRA